MATSTIMEFTDYIAPDGEIYEFDEDMKWLVSEEGLGMPPVEYITHKAPTQHGETVVDYRLQKRIVQLVERVDACDRIGYWEERSHLLDLMRPNRQLLNQMAPGVLRKRLSDGTVRCLDVLIEQGPIFTARQQGYWDEWGFTETLRFIAHDPTFYDPEEQIIDIVDPYLIPSSHLQFPITFPIEFSSALLTTDSLITYTGTWHTYPTLEIDGPMQGITIRNNSIVEHIAINYNLPAGQTLIVSLPFGNKRVYNEDTGQNLIGSVTLDSYLATFRIEPHPTVLNGENDIEIVGIGTDPATTAMRARFYTRFIGI